ncbi:hypothetical protein [Halosegnis marinus]|uniref:hypothetical protein n=1 Tax=Halosegnis marinus TaxID=3034023 RepID=UPI00360F3424
MQAALAAATVWAALARDPTLVVNTGVPLAVTLLPAVLRRRRGYAMDAGLVAWLTLASALHAAGAVWLYGRFGWYDSVTHTLSASMVAGLGYAVARATERHSRAVSFGRGFRATFVVLFVLAVGVGWEILEFASGGLASSSAGRPCWRSTAPPTSSTTSCSTPSGPSSSPRGVPPTSRASRTCSSGGSASRSAAATEGPFAHPL